MASLVYKSIVNRMSGKTIPEYHYHDYGSLVSLGRYGTVGNLMGNLTGSVMLEGWLAGGLSAGDVIVQDPSPPPEIVSLLQKHGVTHVEKLTETTLDAPPAVILMAVKPQIMRQVCEGMRDAVQARRPLIVSVAAGDDDEVM